MGGQRWKVLSAEGGSAGLAARESKDHLSRELPELLPSGAVVEECALEGDCLQFRRISGLGPLHGWVDIKSHGLTLLVKVVPKSSQALAGKAEEVTQTAQSTTSIVTPFQGQRWEVIGARQDGLLVNEGPSLSSAASPLRLLNGVVVEEIALDGDRLHFKNLSMLGPQTGWVSIGEKGRPWLARSLQQSSEESRSFWDLPNGSTSVLEGLPHSAAAARLLRKTLKEQPLVGWENLQQRPGQLQLAAAAAETAGEFVSQSATHEALGKQGLSRLPSLEELLAASPEQLSALTSMDESDARNLCRLDPHRTRQILAEARAFMLMSEEERQDALDQLRKAWPKGPFPTFAKKAKEDDYQLLRPGTCFPFLRNAGLEVAAQNGKAQRPPGPPAFPRPPGGYRSSGEAQVAKLNSMDRQESAAVAPSSQSPEVAWCYQTGEVDIPWLSAEVANLAALRPEDIARYLNAVMRQRPCILDTCSLSKRLAQQGLSEADYRGQRLSSFQEQSADGPISLKGNEAVLVLTQPELIVQIHKEFLSAGADVCRTNSAGATVFVQRRFRLQRLVYEMNKAAAQLAKTAAAEVTKQEPSKPRLVAGVIGFGHAEPGRSASWMELVEAFSEQIRGLAEGGCDFYSFEECSDGLSAKAAIYAFVDYFERAQKRPPPLMLNMKVDAAGRLSRGQSLEAFLISIKHARPFALGLQVAGENLQEMQSRLSQHATCWTLAAVANGQIEQALACAKAGVMNMAAVSSGLPSEVAALAKALAAVSSGLRALPAASSPRLQLSGLEVVEATSQGPCFRLISSDTSALSSTQFRRCIENYNATRSDSHLQEAIKHCAAQSDKGADILDINLDTSSSDQIACATQGTMWRFLTLSSGEPRMMKSAFMLCSSEFRVIQEGLRCVQGRCLVNGLCLALGNEEFLKLAKEVQRYGAALVVLAVSETGPAVTCADKVKVLERSYQLLRTLNFPAEDIVFDCGIALGDNRKLEVKPFLDAMVELRRKCPLATFMAGTPFLTSAFAGYDMLRDSLHSVFLHEAVPRGLCLATAEPGNLPLVEELDPEVRDLCRELLLDSSPDQDHVARFEALALKYTGNLCCLPYTLKQEDGKGAQWNEKRLQTQRCTSRPAEQKAYLQTLRCRAGAASASGSGPWADARNGAAMSDSAKQRMIADILARRPARGVDASIYLHTEMRSRILMLDGDVSALLKQEKLTEIERRNTCALAVTKPDVVERCYREFLLAGADICRTDTALGSALSQETFGTALSVYEMNRASASLAKRAAAEVTSQQPSKPRFVAGVIAAVPPNESVKDEEIQSSTWAKLTAAYSEQVQALVAGGVDLIIIDVGGVAMAGRAAVLAVRDHFARSTSEALPLIISGTLAPDGRLENGQSVEAFVVSLNYARPLAMGLAADSGASGAALGLACSAFSAKNPVWSLLSLSGERSADVSAWISKVSQFISSGITNIIAGGAGTLPHHMKALATQSCVPRGKLGPVPYAKLELAGLHLISCAPEDGLRLIGQRCNMNGCKDFSSHVEAYKFAKPGSRWEAAVETAAKQLEESADMLEVNLDSEVLDTKWAMRRFLQLLSLDPRTANAPLVISSSKWDVIEEGLRVAPGKCLVNAASLVQGEAAFLNVARACLRYGAAIVVILLEPRLHEIQKDGTQQEPLRLHDLLSVAQRTYKLLRGKLDFPAADIVFDCGLGALQKEALWAGPRITLDCIEEVRSSCPGVSIVSNMNDWTAPLHHVNGIREALSSTFLFHAVPKGLNLVLANPGALPRYTDLEATTKTICNEVVLEHSSDNGHMQRLMKLLGPMTEAPSAGEADPAPETKSTRSTATPAPKIKQPISALVQATGTINASLFQLFGSKSHAANVFHRLQTALGIKRTVHFSSISVYMGQGGSGPITGASSYMDALSMWERHQGYSNCSVTVLWGAIGEIGLRKAIYGSRDVFAQFDLGQKLINPADTQFLMRAVVCNPFMPEFVGLAYLDQSWKETLTGTSASMSGGAMVKASQDDERKTFADL